MALSVVEEVPDVEETAEIRVDSLAATEVFAEDVILERLEAVLLSNLKVVSRSLPPHV